jgi:hypothetical protein
MPTPFAPTRRSRRSFLAPFAAAGLLLPLLLVASGCGGGNRFLNAPGDGNGGGGGGGTRSPYAGRWSGAWSINTGLVVTTVPGADGVQVPVTAEIGGPITIEVSEDGTASGTLANTSSYANGVLGPGASSTFAGSVNADGSFSGSLTVPGVSGGDVFSGNLLPSLTGANRLRATVRQTRADGASFAGTADLSKD